MAQQTWPHLGLRTAGGQTTFHIGERIPLELSFAGPDTKEFQITTATYDRSGRLNIESYAVTPAAGWSDPLARYFAFGTFFGGGLSSIAELSSKPYVVPRDLNEWVRFDKPGDYSLSVTSHRALPVKHPLGERSEVTLQSNAIQLHIIPATAEWQRQKLASIFAALATTPAAYYTGPNPRTDAVTELRFLGAAGGIDFMAQNLRDGRPELQFQCGLGLVSLPDSLHPAGIAALYRQLDDPDFPVSGWVLRALTTLQTTQTEPRAYGTEYGQLFMAAWQAAVRALPRKNDKARAATAQTLMVNQAPEFLAQTQAQAQIATALSSTFRELPLGPQADWLLWHWDSLDSPAMLSTVRAIATDPSIAATPKDPFSARQLKSAALYRWYQADPDGAYAQVLREIGSADPTFGADDLWFLPDRPIPQLESLWAEAFVSDPGFDQQRRLGSLLARFGTGSAAPAIAGKVRALVGLWACEPQAAALAYLLKFSPDIGQQLLQRALAARGKTGCYHTFFGGIGQYTHSAVLTQGAIAALDDEDPEVSSDAARYLANYGDKSAEQPLWARYQKWHEQWAGHEDIFDNNPMFAEHYKDIGLGENLARALIANQGWVASQESIGRVRQLCVGKQQCGQIDQLVAVHGKGLHVSLSHSGRFENYAIDQYETHSFELFEQKIDQYPRGTVFALRPGVRRTKEQIALEDDVAGIFRRHGMTLLEPEDASGISPNGAIPPRQ